MRVLGAALFELIVAAGLFGVQSPQDSLAPIMVRVAWWVGLMLVAAPVANRWPLFDQWRAVFGWARRVHGRLRGTCLACGGVPESPLTLDA